MANEFRIFGPPGTGKTSTLASRLIPKAAARFGPENVMVCSFTRAAAKEISSKKARETTEFIAAGETIPIPDQNVGTLHSICYRALGTPKIFETDKRLIQLWNEEHPNFGIGGQAVKTSFDEVATEKNSTNGDDYGDKMLAMLNIKRNRMLLDQRVWQRDLRTFAAAFEKFKEDNGCLDFTDLIAFCLKDTIYAPNRPRTVFVDEAQDMTKLQVSLIRRWADDMDELLLVGDDDQAIFVWAGSSPDAFLDPPIDASRKLVLGQSYRVPRLVLERSLRVIERVSEREEKLYLPRKDQDGKIVDGMVSECSSTYSRPESVVSWAKDLAGQGQSVMLIASCSYMLESTKKTLRSQGIPFENRWRRNRSDWNPLYSPPSKNGSVGAIEIIRSFLDMGEDAPYWTIGQLVTWAQFLKVGDSGLIKKRGKKGIEALQLALQTPDPALFTSRNVLHQIMTPTACERALARDTTWIYENLRSERANDKMQYAFTVAKNFGFPALFEEPKISIGTIHSFKGGEANHVFLWPDISWQADNEMQSGQSGIDQACRIFYVGMTRAKQELIICSPNVKKNSKSPRMYVPI